MSEMFEGKEVIIEPIVKASDLTNFIEGARALGVKKFLCKPVEGVDAEFIQLSESAEEVRGLVLRKRITDRADLEKIIVDAKRGAKALLVETADWKIIPLENLIA